MNCHFCGQLGGVGSVFITIPTRIEWSNEIDYPEIHISIETIGSLTVVYCKECFDIEAGKDFFPNEVR